MKHTFNYRIICFSVDEGKYFEVRRVYYEDEKPIAFGECEVSLYGDSISELKRFHKQIGQAFLKPVLDADKFTRLHD